MAAKPVSITEPPNASALSHNHGNEYQVKIVHEDGTEELSAWMNSEEQVTQVMAVVHKPQRQRLLGSGTKRSRSQLPG